MELKAFFQQRTCEGVEKNKELTARLGAHTEKEQAFLHRLKLVPTPFPGKVTNGYSYF
jgi:hypothetical protein